MEFPLSCAFDASSEALDLLCLLDLRGALAIFLVFDGRGSVHLDTSYLPDGFSVVVRHRYLFDTPSHISLWRIVADVAASTYAMWVRQALELTDEPF
jgi:hypothetical protein